MHANVFSLLDKRVKKAMILFAQLATKPEALNYGQLLVNSKFMLKTYLSFFRKMNLLPSDHTQYFKKQFFLQWDLNKILQPKDETCSQIRAIIFNTIRSYLKNDSSNTKTTIPIHFRYTHHLKIVLISGFCIIEPNIGTAKSLLNKLEIPITQLENNSSSADYLFQMLEEYNPNTNISIELLAMCYYKSYKKFRLDCRKYLGTTFYNFYIKLKIIDVINDIMFTEWSIKEITYKNDFARYNTMYKIFKSYNLSINDIPRFYKIC